MRPVDEEGLGHGTRHALQIGGSIYEVDGAPIVSFNTAALELSLFMRGKNPSFLGCPSEKLRAGTPAVTSLSDAQSRPETFAVTPAQKSDLNRLVV